MGQFFFSFTINELFKYGSCCHGSVNVMCVLLNKLFGLRYFPADWSQGSIVPLHTQRILMMLVAIEV